MQEKLSQILEIFNQSWVNTKAALKELGLPENLVELHTAKLPDFNKLLPEEVLKIFHDLRSYVVLYFHNRGFAQREIARRLGGSSQRVVFEIIKDFKKSVQEEENPTKVETKI